MSATVKVRIRAEQRIRYHQVVEMTRAEFLELTTRQRSDPNFGRQIIDEDLGGWLNQRDIDESAGDLEDVEIKEVRPAKSKK